VLPALGLLLLVSGADRGYALFAPGPPTAEALDVVDVRPLTEEQRLPLIVLQGLVNRGPRAHVWLLHAPWDEFWLGQLRERHYVREVLPLTPEEFLSRHQTRYRGVIIYDPSVPASLNVATMMASLEDSLVASPEVAAGLPAAKPRTDLRGRWSSDAEAYAWALEQLWPRMDHSVLALYHHGGLGHMLRDYLVQRRVFTMWVTGADPQRQAAERQVLERLYADSPDCIPVLGFPYSGMDVGLDEYPGVGLGGEYGKITVPCDFAGNVSLLSGVPADVDAARQAYLGRGERPRPALRSDKVYLALCIVESGDAASYLVNRQYQIWQDPARGQVPVNWCIGPSIAELMPPVAEHYLREATPLDHLFCALSGAGYVHPYRSFLTRTGDPEAAWRHYLGQTARLMGRMGLRDLGLYTDAWRPFDRAAMDPTTMRFAEGIPGLETLLLGMGRDEAVPPDDAIYALGREGVTVSHILTRWPVDGLKRSREDEIRWLAEDIRAHTPTERPAFMSAMALSWTHDPSSLLALTRELGDEYVPVLLPEMVSLRRAALTGDR
jgi:hypothetical protein